MSTATAKATAASVALFAERHPERLIPALCEAAAEQRASLHDAWLARGGADPFLDTDPYAEGYALYRSNPEGTNSTIDGSGDPPFLFDDEDTAEAVARILAEMEGCDVAVCHEEWSVSEDWCTASEAVTVVHRDGSTL